jgi:hypothetical protein
MKKPTKKILITILSLLLLAFLIYYLSLPKGRTIQGQTYNIQENSIQFLADLTYEENNTLQYDHEIFNNVFNIIQNAENFILIDMFLFGTTEEPHYRNLTQEQSNPEIQIYFITDEFNVFNKPHNKVFIDKLKQNNINVIYTPIKKNKITNYLLKKTKKGLNHKKLIIADNNNQIVSLITSANPHDKSSPNPNTGFIIKEKIWKDIYESEIKDAKINNPQIQSYINNFQEKPTNNTKTIKVQYLADNGLMTSLYKKLDKIEKGDIANIAMFYLSDKKTINSLTQASNRGATINLILDTNDYFFSQQKFGIPNKPVANQLIKKSNNKINIRWYKPHGEQFHTKFISIQNKTHTTILSGSSNLVKNNIRLYNLQSDIKIIAPNNSTIIQQTNDYFNKMWNNKNNIYTSDYQDYSSNSKLKKLRFEWEQFVRLFQ